MQTSRVSLWIQSTFYVAAGINHFWHTGFYVHLMPDHYTHPALLVQLSGIAEILGGLGLLVPATRRLAAWGIVLMLIVYLDVHFWMVHHPERFPEMPPWLLWARIPFQFVLMAWALHASRSKTGLAMNQPV